MKRRSGHHKRKFYPTNEKKYVGDPKAIVARSSWERIFMIWCDKNPQITAWSSETVVIPYTSPLDGKTHRYFVDFIVRFVDKEGNQKIKLIEIKPRAQRMEPKNKASKGYAAAVETYVVNQAKWRAAEEYARNNNWEFVVLDEYDLGLV